VGQSQVEGRATRYPVHESVEERVSIADRYQGLMMRNGVFDIDHFLGETESYEGIHEIAEHGFHGEFKMTGPVWTLILDNEQTKNLSGLLVEGGAPILAAAGVAAPVIAGSLLASIVYINVVNAIGGHNGVQITGVLGTQGLVVYPRLGTALYDLLVSSAKIGVAGVTITQWMLAAMAQSPALAMGLQFAPLAGIANAVLYAGTPLGFALATAAGWIVNQIFDEPDPDKFGPVVADRNQVGEWESFTIGSCDGNEVSILSHMGHFYAPGGGGKGVYANRVHVGPWERWALIRHGDGTVSFRTANQRFLVAESGGGQVCNANRTSIGPWEKFYLEPLPGTACKYAIKTFVTGQYVCVEKS
jgi:hypothetical protein